MIFTQIACNRPINAYAYDNDTFAVSLFPGSVALLQPNCEWIWIRLADSPGCQQVAQVERTRRIIYIHTSLTRWIQCACQRRLVLKAIRKYKHWNNALTLALWNAYTFSTCPSPLIVDTTLNDIARGAHHVFTNKLTAWRVELRSHGCELSCNVWKCISIYIVLSQPHDYVIEPFNTAIKWRVQRTGANNFGAWRVSS